MGEAHLNGSNPMPLLRPEEYQALRDNIKKNGVLVPVEIDAETGEILDGYHRMKACEELGIRPPVIERRFESEAERAEHKFAINLMRRHLGPIGWARAFKNLAEIRGVEINGKGGRPRKGDNSATVAGLSEEIGVPYRTARYRLKLAEDLSREPDLSAKVDAGEMDAKRALRKKHEREQRCGAEVPQPVTMDEVSDIHLDLRHCDFRDLDLPEGSLDVIIADPPYSREYLDLYADLGHFAASALKSGGLLVCMSGQSYLPEVYERLGRELSYIWTVAYLTPGGQSSQMWTRRVNTFWKPVLIFSNGEYTADWFGDVSKSAVNDNDKRHHRWGQSESGVRDLVERFSRPGDLVCDPFLGGGTTALVCSSTNRRFVGCDLDAEAIAATTRRLGRSGEAA